MPIVELSEPDIGFATYSARKLRSYSTTKTTPERAAVGMVVIGYAFLRLATPIRPGRPEPKSKLSGIRKTDGEREALPADVFEPVLYVSH